MQSYASPMERLGNWGPSISTAQDLTAYDPAKSGRDAASLGTPLLAMVLPRATVLQSKRKAADLCAFAVGGLSMILRQNQHLILITIHQIQPS